MCWEIVSAVTALEIVSEVTALPTLHYIYIHNFNQNLYNWALLIPQHMYVHCDQFYCHVLKKSSCQLPEDGDIIVPKHVGAM